MRKAARVVVGASLALLAAACEPEPSTSSSGGGAGARPGSFQVTRVHHPRGFEVTGGNLVLAARGAVAVVSEPDADRLWLVNLDPATVRGKVALPKGSNPGRMAVDDVGDVYVVLRGLGQVAKVSLSTRSVTLTRDVCGDPRGIVWDVKAHLMRIACGSGELAELPVTGPATVSRLGTGDLRDVLVTADSVKATTFRAAQVVTDGQPPVAPPPATSASEKPVTLTAHVAWRTVVAPDGTVVMAHQREVEGPVEALSTTSNTAPTTPRPAYSSAPDAPCVSPVVRSGVTLFPKTGASTSLELSGTLPVDLAVSPDGLEVAVALAGSGTVERLAMLAGSSQVSACVQTVAPNALPVGGIPDGVAYQPDGTLVVHTSRPSTLSFFRGGARSRGTLELDPSTGRDPGRDFFHTPVGGVACASCHPEGRDDGHVWNVAGQARRTPSLASGVLETAPFHWQGEFDDLNEVVDDTFVHRMGGAKPDLSMVNELANWVEGIARPAPTVDRTDAAVAQVAAGKALFESVEVGCASCHQGDTLSAVGSVDVGTGGRFQVPSLRGVAMRGPWLHDGRAATLHDRFRLADGDLHGATSQLAAEQIDQLVAYLESL
ncbi:MAG: c-type cytochrome [Archangiaceae bacterium]|nr:c-type cytochrome [Archangiaceae bacterium]